MSLKPNLWTVLFFLSIALWGYTQWSTTNEQDAATTDPLKIELYRMKYADYQVGDSLYKNLVLPYLNDSLAPPNLGIDSYKIEWEELTELYQQQPTSHLYIIPIMESFDLPKQGCQNALSLAFSTVPPDQVTAQGAIYNFATPCPPLCSDNRSAHEVVCKN